MLFGGAEGYRSRWGSGGVVVWGRVDTPHSVIVVRHQVTSTPNLCNNAGLNNELGSFFFFFFQIEAI